MTQEEERKALRKERNKRYQDRLKENHVVLDKEKTSLNNDLKTSYSVLTWYHIEEYIKTPQAVFLLVVSLIFTSFLVWQSTLFFQISGMNLTESILFSLVGETLFLCSAAIMFIGKTRIQKLLPSLIFLSSLVTLVAFLHHGASSSSVKTSEQYLSKQKNLVGLRADLRNLRAEREQLPLNRVTRRGEIQTKIDKKISQARGINSELFKLQKGGLEVGKTYLSWLRIAVLLLNITLIHNIIKGFLIFSRRHCEGLNKLYLA